MTKPDDVTDAERGVAYRFTDTGESWQSHSTNLHATKPDDLRAALRRVIVQWYAEGRLRFAASLGGDTDSADEVAGELLAAIPTTLAAASGAERPIDEDPDEDPWHDVFRKLDALVPHYPEDDDDLGEIRRIVNERMDAYNAIPATDAEEET